jgi:phosphatidylserine/phosphatidylglycerophosphate/cardiolipin synthase-like enzyme
MAKWQTVLSAGGNGPPVRRRNRVDPLVDGEATFAAMHAAIRTTFTTDRGGYICLLGWWLDDQVPLLPGDPTSTIERLLTEASQTHDVQIRIMVWNNPLMQPFYPETQTRQHQYLNALPNSACIIDDVHGPTMIHHQKVLVVRGAQGLIAFCGGIDVAPDRVQALTSEPGSPLHDVHCRVVGDAACDLVDVFVRRWEAHPDAARIDGEKGPLRAAADRTPPAAGAPAGAQSVAIARTTSAPDGSGRWRPVERSIEQVLRRAIRAAERYIYIEDQYLCNLEASYELRAALERIRHLTILIPVHPELPFGEIARSTFVQALWSDPGLAARARVFQRTGGAHSYIHSKLWIIDDELAVIGSANCTRRGWCGDSEVAAAVFDDDASLTAPAFARRLRMQLWAEHLGVAPDAVWDGTRAACWDEAAARRRVVRYDPLREASAAEASQFPSPTELVDVQARFVGLTAALRGLLGDRPLTVREAWDGLLDPPCRDPAPCGDVGGAVWPPSAAKSTAPDRT